MERLTLLKNQLSSKSDASFDPEDPKKLLQKYRSKSTVNPQVIRNVIFGRNEGFRQRVIDVLLSDPIFKQQVVTESTRKEIRGISYRWIKTFFDKFGIITYEDYKKDPSVLNITNYFYEFDASMSVKVGVHFNLYLKTIINLGTEKHRTWIDRATRFEDIGCFGLTELGHGSNVRGVLTRADFDPKTREFVITTPTDIGMKFWIGAAAHLANMAIVMAQLYIGDKNYGVHGFIVPIRDKKDHTLLPGVLAGDCGLKVGLNAIDNGFLIFKGVRVPYDNLLDKFSQITPENKFKSSIKSADKRFGISLGSLSGGRIQLVDCSNGALRNALTIAIRYATCRRQFGGEGQAETNIMEYPLTQYRLLPYLAESFALAIANQTISGTWSANQHNIFAENNPMLSELHNLISCIKPVASWGVLKGLQECREICGGLGYSAYNRLGQLREDSDINVTWEGDNNVLLQQTSKFLLDCLKNVKAGNKLPYPSLQFLKEEFQPFESSQGGSPFSKDQYNLKRAFEVRASYLIHASFEYVSKNLMSSEGGLQGWNNSHVFYLRDASLAYGELFIIGEFEKAIENCKDEKTRPVLQKLFELHAFHKLEQKAASFLEIGYFVKEDMDFIRERVKELCKELKDEAVGIIDAIALPDALLNSPIGASDGDVYNRFINAVWSAPGAFERPVYWKEIREGKN